MGDIRGTVARALGWATRDYQATFAEYPYWSDVIRHSLEDLPSDFITTYSLSPASAAWICDFIEREKPKRILECGCGISTVVTALFLRELGYVPADIEFISLEGEAQWMGATQEAARRLGVDSYISLCHTPIEPFQWDGAEAWRFDMSGTKQPENIDLLVIDAPPGKHGRQGTLPSLVGALSPAAWIVLDDAARPAERDAVDTWVSKGLAQFVGYLPVGSGLALLRRSLD